MTAHILVLIAALSCLPLITTILFDLLGPHPTCICAPPPCSAAASASSQSISSAGGVAQPYGPVYAGHPYGGYPYRTVRSKRAAEDQSLVMNESCSSENIGAVIDQSMTSYPDESRELILRSLLNHYGRDVLVVCTPHELDFSFTSGAEFCSRRGDNITCHAFVF